MMTTTRRSFLQLFAGSAAATVVAPVIPEASSPRLAAVGEIDPEFFPPTNSSILKQSGKMLVSWNPVNGASHYEISISRPGSKVIRRALTTADRFLFETEDKLQIQNISIRAVSYEGIKSAPHNPLVCSIDDCDWPSEVD
jgi:hypothetical protein